MSKLTFKTLSLSLTCIFTAASFATISYAQTDKPNVIVIYADDISARELPIYGSTKWSGFRGKSVADLNKRASTPILDKLANKGTFIENAWAATVCSPSRAMMMTGRYAPIHKWWHNSDTGIYLKPGEKQILTPKAVGSKKQIAANSRKGRKVTLFESSDLLIGDLAQKAGYSAFWAGKTQMPAWDQYGFDEGVITPGDLDDELGKNPFTDFNLIQTKVNGKKTLVNEDTGKPVQTYDQRGWYWQPNVTLMNHPSNKGKLFSYWPNTPESIKNYGLHTYGPDVE